VVDLVLKRILLRLAERKQAAGGGPRAEAATVDSPRD
jgi:hypothetical protein